LHRAVAPDGFVGTSWTLSVIVLLIDRRIVAVA